MNQNSLNGENCVTVNKTNIIRLMVALVGTVLLLLAFVTLQGNRRTRKIEDEANQAIVAAERALTEAHGEEVEQAIERFISMEGSYDAIADPDILVDIATGPYLELLNFSKQQIEDSSSWLVTDSFTVDGVRVLEYDPDEFKAIGCGIVYINRVTPQGTVIKELPSRQFRNLFVFVKEDDTWKVAAGYGITDPKYSIAEWEYAEAWRKEAIGDLVSHVYKDCL